MPIFGERVRALQVGLLAGLLVFALALVGVFLLANAAVDLAAVYLSREGSLALVGAIALAPLVIAIAAILLKSYGHRRQHARVQRSAFLESSDVPSEVRELIETVQRLTRTAPLAALALAIVAGVAVIRFPASLALVIAAFKNWQSSASPAQH